MFNKQEDETMKKLILMFAFFAFAFIYKAWGEMNYVSIEGKTYFSDEVKVWSEQFTHYYRRRAHSQSSPEKGGCIYGQRKAL